MSSTLIEHLEFALTVDAGDRVIRDAAIVILTVDRRLPWAALAIVALRDVVLALGGRYLAAREVVIEVHVVGKAATWILYLAVGCAMVTGHSTEWPVALFWAGLCLALLAGAVYVVEARKALRR